MPFPVMTNSTLVTATVSAAIAISSRLRRRSVPFTEVTILTNNPFTRCQVVASTAAVPREPALVHSADLEEVVTTEGEAG